MDKFITIKITRQAYKKFKQVAADRGKKLYEVIDDLAERELIYWQDYQRREELERENEQPKP